MDTWLVDVAIRGREPFRVFGTTPSLHQTQVKSKQNWTEENEVLWFNCALASVKFWEDFKMKTTSMKIRYTHATVTLITPISIYSDDQNTLLLSDRLARAKLWIEPQTIYACARNFFKDFNGTGHHRILPNLTKRKERLKNSTVLSKRGHFPSSSLQKISSL